MTTQIIGQDKLLNKINSFSPHTFPQTILICGECGSGKRLIATYISEKLCRDILDITDRISFETISEASVSPIGYSYLIDCDKLSEKEENVILKFIEEPPENSNVILLTSNKDHIIDTIRGRCVLFELEKYSTDVLKTFIKDTQDYAILKYIHTPGQILNSTEEDINETIALATTIIKSIASANISNILGLSKKFNLTKTSSGTLSFSFLLTVLKEMFITLIELQFDNKYVSAYNLIVDVENRLLFTKADKSRLFDSFLLNLKAVLK